ncbi:MAG: cation tolerance protein CutA [Candidatus Aminicenantes bacterium RBG_13_62_12]|nr:MAG: cation tolerance protein CutA [Candidatus Aminicenantes bacterium RBG_13_62_12]
MSEFLLALTTVPDEAKGFEIARALLEKRLAACVTVTAAARSFYRWQGKICEDAEYVLLIKTRTDLFPALEETLRSLHPYEIPELIAVPVERGAKPYLDWLRAETGTP